MINQSKMNRIDNIAENLWVELEYVHQHYKCLGERIKELERLRAKIREIIHEGKKP